MVLFLLNTEKFLEISCILTHDEPLSPYAALPFPIESPDNLGNSLSSNVPY